MAAKRDDSKMDGMSFKSRGKMDAYQISVLSVVSIWDKYVFYVIVLVMKVAS